MTTDVTRRNQAEHAALHSWRRFWALAFGFATFVGVSAGCFVYFGMIANRKPLTFRTALLATLPDWYFWACLTPLVFWLGQRFRFERGHWMRAAPVHVIAGVAIALLELGIVTAFNHWFYYNPWYPAPARFWDAYVLNIYRYAHFAFIIYWLIVAAAQAFGFYHRYREEEAEAARLSLMNAELEGKLSRAQLDALRSQLQPHFLFNTLNTVSGLIRERRNEDATDLVARLGQLLRKSLGTIQRDEITLREELDFVEAYLAIESARFRERLEVRFDVEPEALEAKVPTMILQPLVENAIRHGLRETSPGRLWIGARRENGHVLLEVRDNGRGLDHQSPENGGSNVGLANTRARLATLYGDACRFELSGAADEGTRVSIRIPRRDRVDAS